MVDFILVTRQACNHLINQKCLLRSFSAFSTVTVWDKCKMLLHFHHCPKDNFQTSGYFIIWHYETLFPSEDGFFRFRILHTSLQCSQKCYEYLLDILWSRQEIFWIFLSLPWNVSIQVWRWPCFTIHLGNRPDVLCRITGRYLYQNLSLNKVEGCSLFMVHQWTSVSERVVIRNNYLC